MSRTGRFLSNMVSLALPPLGSLEAGLALLAASVYILVRFSLSLRVGLGVRRRSSRSAWAASGAAMRLAVLAT